MGRSAGGRIVTIIGGLLILGIALRLVAGIFRPVLPAELMQSVSEGWAMLYGIIAPALAAIAAVAILAAICWVAAALLRR
ncbi:hypothetical protein [Phytohabitans suffuscus]|uniref:Uncharacterized protein n=1 Tax=Phytohabitans suffuscus TaxID=624315 RepID=A0A6F8YEC1_9ACTN|nr:hypothetical protein [Phytohabitans suffuscus]BCB84456.1 hypothetical protein Psuf_017690 [Phytohabitans suffuscus]